MFRWFFFLFPNLTGLVPKGDKISKRKNKHWTISGREKGNFIMQLSWKWMKTEGERKSQQYKTRQDRFTQILFVGFRQIYLYSYIYITDRMCVAFDFLAWQSYTALIMNPLEYLCSCKSSVWWNQEKGIRFADVIKDKSGIPNTNTIRWPVTYWLCT